MSAIEAVMGPLLPLDGAVLAQPPSPEASPASSPAATTHQARGSVAASSARRMLNQETTACRYRRGGHTLGHMAAWVAYG